MWDGSSGGAARREEKDNEETKATDEDVEQRNATRLAASALAAFANPTGTTSAAVDTAAATAAASARLRAYQDQAVGYDYQVPQLSNHSLLYQSHAAEALRRQEEMQIRQQALYSLQQQRVLQQQELQELEYARQRQRQRCAELFAQPGQDTSRVGEAMSVLEAVGRPHPNEQQEPPKRKHIPIAPRAPRGKPEAMASAIAAASIPPPDEDVAIAVAVASTVPSAPAEPEEPAAPATVPAKPPPAKKKPRKRKASTSPAGRSRKKTHVSASLSIEDPVPPITDVEYRNAQDLMRQFCKVPFLAEFSRPVALLHPELIPKYNKIVTHPMDLGHVCRSIERKEYANTRAIQLDMWRIFANCIKYHTSPANKDNSVPSFVSIALHLRDYFNALWQEYMVPSDTPGGVASKSKNPKNMFSKRDKDRKNRIATTSATLLSIPTLEKARDAIGTFIKRHGCVDDLDTETIINLGSDEEMQELLDNLESVKRKIAAVVETEQDYDVKELDADLRACYSDIFEERPALRLRIGHRIDRMLGKIIVNIYEANSRGVNQSSVWGCMAAAIWARENGKKPYWPALVLGIMAPEDQKEDWHATLTERNENRLPEKLRADLQAGKRKAELSIKRQNAGNAEQNSFFLVEFMGTHEFVWVKEADMIETFDPDMNPNQASAAGNVTKKKRASRSTDVLGSETFATAIEEGRWALEEFEMQLQDTCGDLDDGRGEDINYSYDVLNQTDDEAEEEGMAHPSDPSDMTFSETEEANELLAGDGLLDFSTEGRKNAKKRATAMKKKKVEADKASKKDKGGRSKKTSAAKRGHLSKRAQESDEKREQRELAERRKKRTRERDRVLKQDSRKKKKRRTSTDDDDAAAKTVSGAKRNPLADKSGRASAITKAYLIGIAQAEDLKPLGVSGVMNLPSAQLDSTGLLGMALAFRAAAGDLPMPESGDPDSSKRKPWETIDVDGPVSTKEREENLMKQKLLLENEIKRLKAATEKRKELRKLAIAEKVKMLEDVAENDRAVRLSLEKKSRKKPAAKKSPKVDQKDIDKSAENESETKDTSMEIEPASGASSPVIVGEAADDDEDVIEATIVGDHEENDDGASQDEPTPQAEAMSA